MGSRLIRAGFLPIAATSGRGRRDGEVGAPCLRLTGDCLSCQQPEAAQACREIVEVYLAAKARPAAPSACNVRAAAGEHWLLQSSAR